MSTPVPPHDFVLRDPINKLTKHVAMVLVVVPFGVVVLSLIAGIGTALFIGVLALSLAALVGQNSLRAAFAWHPPQLEVPIAGYTLGSNPVVIYRRKPKRVTDIGSFGVQSRLVCREEVTYTVGTDTSTESRNVFEQKCRGSGEGTAEGLVAKIELPISAHVGAPTMRLPHNNVDWLLTVEVSGQRLPKDEHTFTIDVQPILDVSYRRGLQDT